MYTDKDINSLNSSRLIFDNFEVDDPKVHHPTPENSESQYRGIHYTVKLREDRTRLPEYAKFAGLRCEIQIQTILHHAWSETSHDIVYKGKAPPGFGTQAMKRIEQTFNSIMNDYLIPAGRAIQLAQDEYDRLMSGKQLFDADVVRQLDTATNNNERFDILTRLKTDTIPHFDDIPAAFSQLREPLVRAVRAGRNTPKASIATPYGDMEGHDADRITRLVVEIMSQLRYAEPVETFKALGSIYRGETDADIRKQIENAVKALAEFNIAVLKQAGLDVQLALVEHVNALTDAEIGAIRPLVLTVWREALQGDITGTTWTADSVTLSTGAISPTEAVKTMRSQVMAKLFEQFDKAADDAGRREILNALDAATRTPHNAAYSDELYALTLDNAKQIVDFLTARAGSLSYELLQHVEHGLLYDYYRATPHGE